MKPAADETVNMTQMMRFHFNKHFEKGDYPGHQHFLLSYNISKAFFTRVVKPRNGFVKR